MSYPEKGGAYRKQAEELVPYNDTKYWRMIQPLDWELLLNFCFNPKDDAQKVRELLIQYKMDKALISDPDKAVAEIKAYCKAHNCQDLLN